MISQSQIGEGGLFVALFPGSQHFRQQASALHLSGNLQAEQIENRGGKVDQPGGSRRPNARGNDALEREDERNVKDFFIKALSVPQPSVLHELLAMIREKDHQRRFVQPVVFQIIQDAA